MTRSKTSVAISGLNVISSIVTFITTFLALVVAFVYRSCDETLSNWLLVYGLMCPIIFSLIIFLICLATPCMILAFSSDDNTWTDDNDDVPVSAFPIICCFFLIIIIVLSLMFGWTVYGAVLFLPIASGPYPNCPDGQDGRVLVITGTVIIILRFAFTLCPGFEVNRIGKRNRNRREDGLRTWTYDARSRNSKKSGKVEVV